MEICTHLYRYMSYHQGTLYTSSVVGYILKPARYLNKVVPYKIQVFLRMSESKHYMVCVKCWSVVPTKVHCRYES